MSAIRRKRWTEEEDKELLSLISKSTNNLKGAFIEFHKKHPERTIDTIRARWYGRLRLNNDVRVVLKDKGNVSKKNFMMLLIGKFKKLFI